MLVRFLSRGFHNGSIVEAGEVITVSDDTRLGQHMVELDGNSEHLAEHPYVADPYELRVQMTEEARDRAEATRQREAEEERLRVEASTGDQPSVVDGPTPPDSPQEPPDNPDQGGGSADG